MPAPEPPNSGPLKEERKKNNYVANHKKNNYN